MLTDEHRVSDVAIFPDGGTSINHGMRSNYGIIANHQFQITGCIPFRRVVNNTKIFNNYILAQLNVRVHPTRFSNCCHVRYYLTKLLFVNFASIYPPCSRGTKTVFWTEPSPYSPATFNRKVLTLPTLSLNHYYGDPSSCPGENSEAQNAAKPLCHWRLIHTTH